MKVYKLTEENKEAIEEHKKFYKDFEYFGNHIVDKIFYKDTIEDYELTVYSGLHRILELLDTINVMTQQSLINSAMLIARPLLETSLQLKYITDKDDEIEKKSILFQMLDIKRTFKDDESFYNEMEAIECYRSYIRFIKEKEKNFNNYYSYCEGKKVNLYQVFKLVGWEDLYIDIYKPLSIESHGVSHMESNVEMINKRAYLKAFRSFDNNISLIRVVLQIIVPLFTHIIEIYKLNEISKDWIFFVERTEVFLKETESIASLYGNFNRHFF